MNNLLRMRIEIEDDDTAELYAEVEKNGFSGKSSAWFQTSLLIEQARKFAQYPLVAGGNPCIVGGFWNKDATEIEEVHLRITAYPTDNKGGLVLLVELAVPKDNTRHPSLCCSVSVELNTSYEQMSMFARDLESLAIGQAKEIVFNELKGSASN
jgi:hypothetical protein